MSDVLPTVGSNYSREKTMIRRIALVYIIPGPSADNPEEPYELLDTWKPDSTPMGLPEIDRKAKKAVSGEWELEITFEGIPESEPIPAPGTVLDTGHGAEIEIDHAGVEDPIESFEKFDKLKEKYPVNDMSDGRFNGFKMKMPDPDNSQKQILNPLFGTTHFLNDGAIMRLSFASRKFNQDYLKNICKIDTDLIPPELRESVTLPNVKSWLKRSVKAQLRGNVWLFSFEWLLGKWVPDIYLPET